jgi:hypothetical protein
MTIANEPISCRERNRKWGALARLRELADYLKVLCDPPI